MPLMFHNLLKEPHLLSTSTQTIVIRLHFIIHHATHKEHNATANFLPLTNSRSSGDHYQTETSNCRTKLFAATTLSNMNSPVGKGRKSTDENTSDNNSPFHHLVTENQDTTFTQRTPNMESQLQRSFGMLYRLPPELRIMVYSTLVLNRSIAIARVSKAVSEEVRDVITEKGICWVDWTEFYRDRQEESPPEVAGRCKNISVSIEKSSLWGFYSWPPELPDRIVGLKTKNVCWVTVPLFPCGISMLERFTFDLLRVFTGFKELIVRVEIEEEEEEVPFWVPDELEDAHFQKLRSRGYKIINSELRDTFGDGKLVKDEGSREMMIFYPQANFVEGMSEGEGL